jgi:hypothetical protein
MPALYHANLESFLAADSAAVLGQLTNGLGREGFATTPDTAQSWREEIAQLQAAFATVSRECPDSRDWHVLMEYVLPILGKRIDCVLIAGDVVVVIEYKAGAAQNASGALRQAQGYALDLVDFHEESRGRVVVPVAVGRFASCTVINPESPPARGASVRPHALAPTIMTAWRAWANTQAPIDPMKWMHARYFAVPTLIEAASHIYGDHDVREIAHSKSGSDNLDVTQKAIEECVRDAVRRDAKILIVVTGVPGAGKTLVGLNAIQTVIRTLDLAREQAAYLSGNAPLVKVLTEALVRGVSNRQRGTRRAIESRIRDIHRFVASSVADTRPPADRVIVFDEAQRAWTAEKNSKKYGRNIAEPDMVLDIMGRHEGWAVVIALVGGGQEIHRGEAGLAAWGDALRSHSAWEVVTSPEAIRGGPAVAGSRLFSGRSCSGMKVHEAQALHLAVSKRSFEAEETSKWVNACLNGDHESARSIAEGCTLPIQLTRDCAVARNHLRDAVKAGRRAGLIASSGAARLRADGVEPPTFKFVQSVEYVRWFLDSADDFRSSSMLEIALSEFELQGLEIDVAGLLWGGDLVFPRGNVTARRLKGTAWQVIADSQDEAKRDSADNHKRRVINKYRVLLTRFRKQMVIYVPRGDANDATRSPCDFDSVFAYLTSCGLSTLE